MVDESFSQDLDDERNFVQDDSEKEDDGAPTDLRYRISSYGADYPVDSLVKRLSQDDILIPSFQREFVWTLPQASRFLESLLLGLPVPAIFLSKDSDTQKLIVIDGQQRLVSLQCFYDGIFKGKEFELRGVSKQLEGLTYKRLDDEDRRRLNDSIIHAIVIRQEDPDNDDSSVYMVFERLNTTSVALSPQEIRACLYHGSFNDYLGRANQNPDWRAIFGGPNARQKDRELLLRFFALLYKLEDYKRPMKLFLNDFMKENKDLRRYSAATLDGILEPTMELVNSSLGSKAFRPQRALNASVVDAILVSVAQRLQERPIDDHADFKEKLETVIGDDKFAQFYGADTTKLENVRGRINMIAEALESID